MKELVLRIRKNKQWTIQVETGGVAAKDLL